MAAIITTTVRPPPANAFRRRRLALFFGLNFAMLLVIAVGLAFGPHGATESASYGAALSGFGAWRVLYTPTMRGRAAALPGFLGFHFATSALQAIAALLSSVPLLPRPADVLLAPAELAILIGAVAFMAGYGLVLTTI